MSGPFARLERRLEALRARGGDMGPRLERLLNDGYAHVLMLEARRVHLARRFREAPDPAGRRELGELEEEIGALRELLGRARDLGPVGRAAI